MALSAFRNAHENIADCLRRVGGQSVRILIELALRTQCSPSRLEMTVVALTEFLYSHGNERGACEHVPFETPESRACCDTYSARVVEFSRFACVRDARTRC